MQLLATLDAMLLIVTCEHLRSTVTCLCEGSAALGRVDIVRSFAREAFNMIGRLHRRSVVAMWTL